MTVNGKTALSRYFQHWYSYPDGLFGESLCDGFCSGLQRICLNPSIMLTIWKSLENGQHCYLFITQEKFHRYLNTKAKDKWDYCLPVWRVSGDDCRSSDPPSPAPTEPVAPGQVVVLFVHCPLVAPTLGAEDDHSQCAKYSCPRKTDDKMTSECPVNDQGRELWHKRNWVAISQGQF